MSNHHHTSPTQKLAAVPVSRLRNVCSSILWLVKTVKDAEVGGVARGAADSLLTRILDEIDADLRTLHVPDDAPAPVRLALAKLQSLWEGAAVPGPGVPVSGQELDGLKAAAEDLLNAVEATPRSWVLLDAINEFPQREAARRALVNAANPPAPAPFFADWSRLRRRLVSALWGKKEVSLDHACRAVYGHRADASHLAKLKDLVKRTNRQLMEHNLEIRKKNDAYRLVGIN